jgi:hypothetical protein
LSPGRVKDFHVSMSSRPALRPTQPPIQSVPEFLSPRGVKLTTHLQLVPRSRKHGFIHPHPHTSSRRSVLLVKHRENFTFLSPPHAVNEQAKSLQSNSRLTVSFILNSISSEIHVRVVFSPLLLSSASKVILSP